MSEAAFSDITRIYEAYHDRVLACAAKLIGRHEADDVAQDVFVKVGRSIGSLEDRSRLTSWIYAVTLNVIRDRLRSRASRPDSLPTSQKPAGEAGRRGGASGSSSGMSPRTPEEIAIRNEMVACYLDYVRQIPSRYLDVYLLAEFENLSSDDIAQRLSLTPGTVKIRLHRARARLNEELRRHCRCYRNERGELMAEPRKR